MDENNSTHSSDRTPRDHRTTVRRSLVIGLAAMAGAAALFTALPASAEHVSPTTVQGNAQCPAGMTELKIDPVVDGTFTDGTLTVTIDVRDTAAGQVFDWTSNIGVDVVIVKGGNASNVYTYVGESTGDTGLHAPANRSGNFAGLSHISFCYDVGEPPTTAPPTTHPDDVEPSSAVDVEPSSRRPRPPDPRRRLVTTSGRAGQHDWLPGREPGRATSRVTPGHPGHHRSGRTDDPPPARAKADRMKRRAFRTDYGVRVDVNWSAGDDITATVTVPVQDDKSASRPRSTPPGTTRRSRRSRSNPQAPCTGTAGGSPRRSRSRGPR